MLSYRARRGLFRGLSQAHTVSFLSHSRFWEEHKVQQMCKKQHSTILEAAKEIKCPYVLSYRVQTMGTKCWGLRQWNACTFKAEPTISQTNGEVARSWEEKHVRHFWSGTLLLPTCLPRSALLNSYIGKHRQTWAGSTFSCLSNPTLSLVHELACSSPFPMVGCHARP